MKTIPAILILLILISSCKKRDLYQDVHLIKGIKRVWALDDGEKIKREDINNPLASDLNNAVWKDNKINLFGCRNEIIAFQLIIQAEKDGADDVNVSISSLGNGSSLIQGSSQNIILTFQEGLLHSGDYHQRHFRQCIIPDGSPTVLFHSQHLWGKAELLFPYLVTTTREYGWIF
jgi:hypothetical protein